MNADQKACLRAAERIERFGWVQGHMGTSREGYCMRGAFPESCPLLVYSMVGGSITGWNDKRGRTKEQVIDALIAAAYGDWT